MVDLVLDTFIGHGDTVVMEVMVVIMEVVMEVIIEVTMEVIMDIINLILIIIIILLTPEEEEEQTQMFPKEVQEIQVLTQIFLELKVPRL
jgi:hypothetical protein